MPSTWLDLTALVWLSTLVFVLAAIAAWSINRRVRFSMRTLLIVMTVAAVACAIVVGIYRLRSGI